MRNRSSVMFITILIQGKDIKIFKVITMILIDYLKLTMMSSNISINQWNHKTENHKANESVFIDYIYNSSSTEANWGIKALCLSGCKGYRRKKNVDTCLHSGNH